MARLSEDAKTFIVQRLAMFDTPTQVADAVKESFGVDTDRRQVELYDALRAGEKPAARWVALFNATRAKFLATVSDIPIANKAVRLRRLERMAVAAESKKNFPLAAQLHEQAAKEVGDFYTNTRKLAHSGAVGGGVLAVPVPITDEQWTNAAAAQQAALLQRPAAAPDRSPT
jgi:hypothetical protein